MVPYISYGAGTYNCRNGQKHPAGLPGDPKIISIGECPLLRHLLRRRPGNVGVRIHSFFDRIAPVLATGVDAYLLSPLLVNLTGFPPIDIFYGTREVMIAYLKDFKKVCRQYGVELNVHIGRGMMHCWGAMEFVPEAKAVRQEYFQALQ